MSGDVQPRKRKDKKKKKDDLGVEEPRGTAAALGEGDVFMHSYHDHGTGGHWCAKIIFFSLLAVLVTLIGLIILENRGLTELEANSVESRYSGVLEGWIEDAIDDHHDEHTLELKHHDDDDDHSDYQLEENEPEENLLEEEIDHNEDEEDEDESNEDDGQSNEFENDDEEDDNDDNDDEDDERENDDDREDEIENDDEEDEPQSDDDEEVERDHDDDEEDETDNDNDEDQDEGGDNEDDEEIEENLQDADHEDNEEETYEQYSYEEISKSKNDMDDEDEDDDERKHDYLSKEMTSHYNYHESYENNGNDDETNESKYEDGYESNEQNTEEETNEEGDQDDDDDDEQEIEKIEKEIIDGDDSEEIAKNGAPTRDASKEDVNDDSSKEDDEPPIEKISRPLAGKPFIEIEEEIPIKPVDTLADEEAYERQQEELRRQEEEAPQSQGGGNSLEAEWPGEPSDPYWRSQLDAAEEEFRQGRWGAAAQGAGGAGLAKSGRARWLRARALDRAAEQEKDNRVLSEAIAAYLHLLKLNEALSDDRLLEVARRTIDRIQFRGNYLSAEPVYRLLIRRFPDDVEYRNNLTVSYLMANRADLADEVLRETLRLWPYDRVALAHYGFVLKTHHNKLEESVQALRKALDGDAGRANEPRFYYHLGDALLMLGRLEEAHEIHRRGAELGHFLSPSQRSLYNVPRLRSRPWWAIEDTPYVKLARALESSWRDILKEGEAAAALYEREKEGLKDRGEWSQLDIFVRGREVAGRCARARAVCAALRGVGEGENCRRGQVKFSLMAPGTHVRPHVGPTNCRLRMHLALSNTEGTFIRVDKEIRQWQVGKTFIFDDSFEHEVWHNGTAPRLVLIVDVWHPDLTPAERRQLPAI